MVEHQGVFIIENVVRIVCIRERISQIPAEEHVHFSYRNYAFLCTLIVISSVSVHAVKEQSFW